MIEGSMRALAAEVAARRPPTRGLDLGFPRQTVFGLAYGSLLKQ